MLHEILKAYLESVEQAVVGLAHVYVERYVEEILTPKRVNLRIRLRAGNGHLVEIHEAVVMVGEELVHLDYRYHCQDEHNNLLFRYDSTPHFPGLPGFPHHKHLADGSVIASERPDVAAVVREAMGSQ